MNYALIEFQSTLPAWGETFNMNDLLNRQSKFQSTLPAWGETDIESKIDYVSYISIHSPRMGRDGGGGKKRGDQTYFNPLSPHGERPNASDCVSP